MYHCTWSLFSYVLDDMKPWFPGFTLDLVYNLYIIVVSVILNIIEYCDFYWKLYGSPEERLFFWSKMQNVSMALL